MYKFLRKQHSCHFGMKDSSCIDEQNKVLTVYINRIEMDDSSPTYVIQGKKPNGQRKMRQDFKRQRLHGLDLMCQEKKQDGDHHHHHHYRKMNLSRRLGVQKHLVSGSKS